MPIIVVSLLVGLWLSPALRRMILALALVLGAYIAWDNLVTEIMVGPNTFEVQEATITLFSDPSISTAGRLKLQIANNLPVELESVDAVVTLEDCPLSGPTACEPIARQSKRIQLLAPPRTARRAETWVYFANLPSVRGSLVGHVQLVGGVADRF